MQYHPKIELKNEDCRDIFKLIPDNSIDLVITDPPYKTTRKGCTGTTGGMLKNPIVKTGKMFKYNDIKPSEYIPEFFRVLKDGSHCYIMTNHTNLQNFLNVSTDCGFKFIKCLIWNKGNKIMGRFYMSQYEYIIFLRKGKGIQINNCGTSDILNIPNKKLKDAEGHNLHDAEKPVNLMKILIENSSSEIRSIIFDPFFGIGAVPIACKLSNRNFYGCEIDTDYFNIAKSRLKNTNK